jgi:lipopolysaccharide biosynthesis glycosyltransferase
MKIPIFLSSDNTYAPFVATTTASICYNTKELIALYVLDDGISEFNKSQINLLKNSFNNLDIEYITIDTDNIFRNIQYRNANTYITISSYNRLLIPQLKSDIDKAIYFDVDVICLCDCAELYNIDMHNYALAAAPDYMPERLVKNLRTKLHWSAEHKYFNAGVLVLDLKQWREKNITAALFEIEKKCRENLRNADQDVLNTYFDNNYQQLETEYNYTTNNLDNIPAKIYIRHFLSKFKPWNSYKYADKPIINFKEF